MQSLVNTPPCLSSIFICGCFPDAPIHKYQHGVHAYSSDTLQGLQGLQGLQRLAFVCYVWQMLGGV